MASDENNLGLVLQDKGALAGAKAPAVDLFVKLGKRRNVAESGGHSQTQKISDGTP